MIHATFARRPTVEDDPRDVRKRLHVVDVGRLVDEPLLRRERRLEARHAAMALQRLDEGGLLAADECARASLDLDVAREGRAKDVRPQQMRRPRIRQRLLQAHDRERILRPHIDERRRRANRVGRDQHALDERVRVGLDDRAIHERAGVALVRVADEVFVLALGVARGVPLEPCGKARTAAARQARSLDFLDYLFRRHAVQNLRNRLVAVRRPVGVQRFRVDQATMPERNARLLVKKLLVRRRNLQIHDTRKVS